MSLLSAPFVLEQTIKLMSFDLPLRRSVRRISPPEQLIPFAPNNEPPAPLGTLPALYSSLLRFPEEACEIPELRFLKASVRETRGDKCGGGGANVADECPSGARRAAGVTLGAKAPCQHDAAQDGGTGGRGTGGGTKDQLNLSQSTKIHLFLF